MDPKKRASEVTDETETQQPSKSTARKKQTARRSMVSIGGHIHLPKPMSWGKRQACDSHQVTFEEDAEGLAKWKEVLKRVTSTTACKKQTDEAQHPSK